jgi:hypothetical protein
MARIDPDDLAEPERVFIAATLRLALQAEELLTTRGVDYAVQVEEYTRSFLFGTPRNAAVFYVASVQAQYCRVQLQSAGLGKGIIDDPEAGSRS